MTLPRRVIFKNLGHIGLDGQVYSMYAKPHVKSIKNTLMSNVFKSTRSTHFWGYLSPYHPQVNINQYPKINTPLLKSLMVTESIKDNSFRVALFQMIIFHD